MFVFSFILMGVAAGQVLHDGVGVLTILWILPNFFPLISPMVLPLAIVTGILVCYGRLSGTNEFAAAQASGIHPGWFAAPALVVALLAATITVFLNDTILTVATNSIHSTIIGDKAEIIRRRLIKPGSTVLEGKKGQSFAICRLRRQDDKAAIDITRFEAKTDKKSDGNTHRWNPDYPYQVERFVARDHSIGDLRDTEDENTQVQFHAKGFLQIDLDFQDISKMKTLDGTRFADFLPASGTKPTIDPDRITFWSIRRLIQQRRERLADLVKNSADFAAEADATPELKESHEKFLRGLRRSIDRITAALHLKLALSFACIGFAIVGIPLGLLSRRQSATTGFAIGTAVAVVYFILVKSLQAMVQSGFAEWWLIWCPNLVLLVLGAWLWQQSRRID